jgi:hypothetical protein
MEWDIDGLKEEENLDPQGKTIWEERSLKKPVLDEQSNGEDLQTEAD